MNTQTQYNENIKFAVEVRAYDGAWSKAKKDSYGKKLRHYKECAAYCAKVLSDPNNIRYAGDGSPRWTMEHLAVLDNGYELVWFNGGKVWYEKEALVPDTFGPVMYIVQAMMNAVHEVEVEANREMTPAEIEKEFGLNRGVVRKYIHDHRDVLLELECIRKADARTWLCKRGWAINVWRQSPR